jgi:hypothetical protein
VGRGWTECGQGLGRVWLGRVGGQRVDRVWAEGGQRVGKVWAEGG